MHFVLWRHPRALSGHRSKLASFCQSRSRDWYKALSNRYMVNSTEKSLTNFNHNVLHITKLKRIFNICTFNKDYDDDQSTWGDWRMCENGVDCKERPVSVSCTSGRSIRFRNCSQGSLILDGQCRGEYLYCSDPMSKCCRKFILRNI